MNKGEFKEYVVNHSLESDFIPYKEALALKELGFDELTFGYFFEDGTFMDEPIKRLGEKGFPLILAPLYQQAFRWFREKYNLVAEIQAPDGKDGKWNPTIHKSYGFGNYYDNDGFNSYEEAELACLRKLIEIVKDEDKER